jgi:hypothetical protein
MISGRTASLITLTAALCLAGCAQYAKVAEKRPRFIPHPVGLGVLQGVEKAPTNALQRERRKLPAALGEYLTAVKTAAQQLRHNPEDASPRRHYNFAVSRVFATIRGRAARPLDEAAASAGRWRRIRPYLQARVAAGVEPGAL